MDRRPARQISKRTVRHPASRVHRQPKKRTGGQATGDPDRQESRKQAEKLIIRRKQRTRPAKKKTDSHKKGHTDRTNRRHRQMTSQIDGKTDKKGSRQPTKQRYRQAKAETDSNHKQPNRPTAKCRDSLSNEQTNG